MTWSSLHDCQEEEVIACVVVVLVVVELLLDGGIERTVDVMLERAQVRDGQSQLLAVTGRMSSPEALSPC
jgi:hypothetical protein